jgi:hypothetical protein
MAAARPRPNEWRRRPPRIAEADFVCKLKAQKMLKVAQRVSTTLNRSAAGMFALSNIDRIIATASNLIAANADLLGQNVPG